MGKCPRDALKVADYVERGDFLISSPFTRRWKSVWESCHGGRSRRRTILSCNFPNLILIILNVKSERAGLSSS